MANGKPPKNKALSKRVLARRQKDLNGWLEAYQHIIDQRSEKYSSEILPSWNRIKLYLKRAILQLYEKYADENGVLQENKLYEMERLQLLQRFVAWLTAAETEQREKMTRNLAYQYTEAYYFHAFGVEQAAKVAVQVPIISHAQVMGVIINPWLPDGATYSERLRANTAFLATKMKDAVEEAISTGSSVFETARRIEDIAGEGYHNAVRLARTELNRAASQGASHLYMQNADILDNKRWNATLDSRTAPKDAANDMKVYPLGYDTPEMPGRPGERIPNHPNCRCKWTPVLSALGISTKERVARGAGDTPSEFGERIYTEAADYREYAAERGLPDLDDRLRNDDPSRYLRNGETA